MKLKRPQGALAPAPATYLVRNNMDMPTKAITDGFGSSNSQWGVVISLGTVACAFSKSLSGVAGDRSNPRFLLGIALPAFTWNRGLPLLAERPS